MPLAPFAKKKPRQLPGFFENFLWESASEPPQKTPGQALAASAPAASDTGVEGTGMHA
jgi:hypothetical protein